MHCARSRSFPKSGLGEREDGTPSAAAADWAAREARRRVLPLRLVHAWGGLTTTGTDPDLRCR
ncbi:hypothetical protein CCS38_28545 [Streptomyces purpurogeneiscleroticus]|nr:hypothetical protein [Streptomyces purpurogeneiscleroticus]